jgi:hypothetical protein
MCTDDLLNKNNQFNTLLIRFFSQKMQHKSKITSKYTFFSIYLLRWNKRNENLENICT